MSGKTEINTALLSDLTEINSAAILPVGGGVTDAPLSAGYILNEKYTILRKLNVTTGEADLFLCEHDHAQYAAKIYRRDISIKSDVIEKLREINSPYISKIVDTGLIGGKVYEILPYYKNGSLQGRTFVLEHLKKFIIPCIAEGLRILHSKGIIHKDLKPSNIMLCDDGQSVAIIDFGISSLKSGGSTVIITSTGMTPEYSAPEAFKGLFLAESDYYSLGVTIYELFCGTTPYKNMPDDEIEKYVSIQRLPKPEFMPDELYELINGLTYYDITNRRDKDNPNRRWTYAEVANWLNGVKQQAPGVGMKETPNTPAYSFMGEKYDDIPTLVAALGKNWDEGKKQLSRGLLSGFFKGFDSQIAGFCIDAENEIIARKETIDIIFFKLLYRLHSGLKEFYFGGRYFKSLPELGAYMFAKLAVNDTTDYNFYKDILSNEILSMYAGFIDGNEKLKYNLTNLEEGYKRGDSRNKEVVFYVTAYLLSGRRTLDIEGKLFESVEELAAFMDKLMQVSCERLEMFCRFLIDNEFELVPEFEGWLIVMGKKAEITAWRSALS